MRDRLGDAAIDFTAVPDLDDFNGAPCVIDGINDSKLALANAIASLRSGKFFTPSRPRFGGKRSDSVHDALAVLLLTQSLDLFPSGRLDEQPISGHVALGHGQKIRKKYSALRWSNAARSSASSASATFTGSLTTSEIDRSAAAVFNRKAWWTSASK